jgi:hypothetical protein
MAVVPFLRGLDILGRLDEVLTAPTGSAAAHIGGTTLGVHRFLRGWQGNIPVALEDKTAIGSYQNIDY